MRLLPIGPSLPCFYKYRKTDEVIYEPDFEKEEEEEEENIHFETLDEYESYVHHLEQTNQEIPENLISEEELEQLKADQHERDVYYGRQDTSYDEYEEGSDSDNQDKSHILDDGYDSELSNETRSVEGLSHFANTGGSHRGGAASPTHMAKALNKGTKKKGTAVPYGRWLIFSFLSRKTIDVGRFVSSLGFSPTEIIPVVVAAGENLRYHVGMITPMGYKRNFLKHRFPIELEKQALVWDERTLENRRSWDAVKRVLRKISGKRKLESIKPLLASPQSPNVTTVEKVTSSKESSPITDMSTFQDLKQKVISLEQEIGTLKVDMTTIVQELWDKLLASKEMVTLGNKYKVINGTKNIISV